MSEQQLEAAFEDVLHRLAHKFNKRGLSIAAIGDSFADRARFCRYIEPPRNIRSWFRVRRRRGGGASSHEG